MAKRGENIRKRKDGRWEKRYIESYRPDGTASYKSLYGKSYTEVKSKYSLLQNGSVKKEPTTILSVDRLCILWLEDVQITVKKSTYANYYSIVHNHIVPYFQGMKTRGLTNEAVNGFIREKTWNGRLDGNGGLSPKTVSDIAIVLKAIIQYGTDNKHLSGVTTKLKLPKVPEKLLKVLSIQEQSRLVGHVTASLNLIGIGILICLYTGIRVGELCALLWSDIDFETGVLRITKTLQRIRNTEENATAKTKIVIDTPKSAKSVREIPL